MSTKSVKSKVPIQARSSQFLNNKQQPSNFHQKALNSRSVSDNDDGHASLQRELIVHQSLATV